MGCVWPNLQPQGPMFQPLSGRLLLPLLVRSCLAAAVSSCAWLPTFCRLTAARKPPGQAPGTSVPRSCTARSGGPRCRSGHAAPPLLPAPFPALQLPLIVQAACHTAHPCPRRCPPRPACRLTCAHSQPLAPTAVAGSPTRGRRLYVPTGAVLACQGLCLTPACARVSRERPALPGCLSLPRTWS